MICWLVILGLSGVVWSAETTNDYRQPYKFVKPLTDLGDIYQRRSERKTPIVEKRLGFSSRMDGENKGMEISEVTPMASALKAPPPPQPESMPKAEALKSRSRKKTGNKEIKDEKSDEETENSIANHRIEDEDKDKDEKAQAESRGGPKAEPLRQRQRYTKPEPEEEYEYYYDDSYYYDEEYEDYPTDAYPPKYSTKPKYTSHSSPSSKYPNFPEGKQKAPTQKLSEPPTQKYSKPPTHKYSQPPTQKYSQRPTQKYSKDPSPKYNKNSSRKPSSSDMRSKPSSKSSHKSSSHNYDIENTLNRLNALKSSHKKRKGTPYSFERYNPDTKYNNENRYIKKEPERREPIERKFKPKPAAPPKSYAEEYSEYYDDYEDYKDDPFYTQEAQFRRPVQRSGGGGGGGANPLALLLAPLAGIALLTAAAAVAINPVLVSVSFTGRRRRRREADELNQGLSPALEEKINEMQVLEQFMASVPDNLNYQQQVLSMYLSCSGYTEVANRCLDRTVCEYGNANSSVSQEERDVISIVLYNIMANQFVEDEFKDRLRLAARQGRDSETCEMFECTALHGQFDINELE